MNRFIMVPITLVALGMLLIGCGKFSIGGEDGEETTIDTSGLKDGEIGIETKDKDGKEGSVSIESDEDGGTKMTMDTDEGTIESTSGENTELPDGFPEDFPFPDSATLSQASTMVADDVKTYSIYFSFSEDPEGVYNAIKEYASNKGMEVNFESVSEQDGQKTYMFNAGQSDSEEPEYFQLGIGSLEEKTASVTYGLPNE